MLSFTCAVSSQTSTLIISIQSTPRARPLCAIPLIPQMKPISSTLKLQTLANPSKSRKFLVFAENGDGQLNKDPKGEKEKEGDVTGGGGDGDGDGDGKNDNNGRPRFNLRWVDLLLDPDPDNVVAVGLTGVLAWASVQVLWQLLFISLAIIVAALKYSFIAALLIFILITLL